MPSSKSFHELVASYQQGERDFQGSVLDKDPNNNLSGACLDGIDLSHSSVVADFRGASLRAARFCNANLKTCDFRDADLTNAVFTGAALCATTFVSSILSGTDFDGPCYHSYVMRQGEHPNW
jgi:uncharacterized protein YjbI with pentapeptide repeats